MDKKVIIIGHGITSLMIGEALAKANLTSSDVIIVEEGTDEANRLLSQNRQFPKIEEKTFKIEALPPMPEYFFDDYKNLLNRKTKGGKKNKRNWKY